MKVLGGGVRINPKVPFRGRGGISPVVNRATHDGNGAKLRDGFTMGFFKCCKIGDRPGNNQLQIVMSG